MSSKASCAVCGGFRLESVKAVQCEHLFCLDCLHSQRGEMAPFPYGEFAMCADGTDPLRLQSQMNFILSHVKQEAEVLEIGCASGDLAAAIQLRRPDVRYDAIEISPAQEKARLRVDELYLQPLGDCLDGCLIYPRSYDVVIISHVLEHLADVRREIALIRELLQPDGKLFIEVPNRSGHPALPLDDDIGHLHSFSVSSLSRLLADAGFQCLVLTTGNAVYGAHADAIRVIAQPFKVPEVRKCLPLSQLPVIVWGAGNRARGILGNFVDLENVLFFVDSDEAKQGRPLLGLPVFAPFAIERYPGIPIFICAIEAEAAIRRDIQRLGYDRGCPVSSLTDLLKSAA